MCLCLGINQSALVIVIILIFQKIHRSYKIITLQGGILLLLPWVIWLYRGLKGRKVHHCAEYKSMGYVPVYSHVLYTHASCFVAN